MEANNGFLQFSWDILPLLSPYLWQTKPLNWEIQANSNKEGCLCETKFTSCERKQCMSLLVIYDDIPASEMLDCFDQGALLAVKM